MTGQSPHTLWALVPARGFRRAKTRLSSSLSGLDRAALARWLLERTLEVLGACVELRGVAVITDCLEVAEVAVSTGSVGLFQRNPRRKGPILSGMPGSCRPGRLEEAGNRSGRLGRIVDDGLEQLVGLGADAALVVMADLPDLELAEVVAMARRLKDVELVIAPDEREEGTNALALRGIERFTSQLGHPDSFERHLRYANRTGRRADVFRSPGLAFDLDTPEQLHRLWEFTPVPAVGQTLAAPLAAG